ncbi:MAG: hypothetical protein A2W19_10765 [Spirochaetes bacterium RBG_16_49_21]|nr:MAG: hypothetical protein A2W19_10765 [Spirochaetes bacterium RBG_16_49_21]
MKQLILATTKNFLYREELVRNGYSVTEYNLPVPESGMEEIESLESSRICIAEVSEEIVNSNSRLFDVLRKKGKILCLSGQISNTVKKFLLDHGISDLLQNPSADRLMPYVRIMSEKTLGRSGSMVILDDSDAAKEVLKNIITRFDYQPVFIASVEELFCSALNSGVRFVLVNLSARSLDLNGLVKKFYACQHSTTIPVLVYKDMREGLFVHELVSGLNRVTRFILSLDELFSFLVDVLFKKEMIPLLASLKKSSDFDHCSSYADETVSRIFFMNEKSIFNQANILTEKNFNEMMRLIRAMETTLLKVFGLRWLKIEADNKGISTAGKGE